MIQQEQPLSTSRIVFWEPCTSPHKADFFSAIAEIAPEIEVVCCAHSNLSKERQDQGWLVKPTDTFQTIVAPNQIEINQLVGEQVNTTLHIFSGIRWFPNIVAGLKAVKRTGARFAIMSEPRVFEGWKGKVRFLQSWLTEHWLRRNVAFVLAQGSNGPTWFRSVGYQENRIFPFAYFIDPPKHHLENEDLTNCSDRPIQIGYVGRLVKMKGIFDLVAAVAELGTEAQLSIVGSGEDEQALRNACNILNLDARFIGTLPINEIGSFMHKLDVLVLASTTTDDGWGVVVSEALMCGTTVIVTPCVGASLVLNEPQFGRCVPSGSPHSIAEAVRDMQDSDAFAAEARAKRKVLACSRLSAESGARYLINIIKWRFDAVESPVPFYEA
jgi:glycosyltransferase involved in cell wall biosynthesis